MTPSSSSSSSWAFRENCLYLSAWCCWQDRRAWTLQDCFYLWGETPEEDQEQEENTKTPASPLTSLASLRPRFCSFSLSIICCRFVFVGLVHQHWPTTTRSYMTWPFTLTVQHTKADLHKSHFFGLSCYKKKINKNKYKSWKLLLLLTPPPLPPLSHPHLYNNSNILNKLSLR